MQADKSFARILQLFSISLIVLITFNNPLFAKVPWDNLNTFQKSISRKTFEKNLNLMLLNQSKNASEIESFLTWDDEKIEIYSDNGNKAYTFYFAEEGKERVINKLPKNLNSTNLSGLKIAIDPGSERSIISLKKSNDKLQAFNYRNLTFGVSTLLKKKLEQLGANVFLAKNSSTEVISLKEVNQRINNFKPHLTLGIHFNVHKISDESGIYTPVLENYIVSFSPGCFLNDELESEMNRYEFVRDMVSLKAQKSLAFTKVLSHELQTKLNLPFKELTDYPFENHACKVKEGICTRNLSLLRGVESIVSYPFPLCMDNEDEFYELAKEDLELDNFKLSSKANLLADIYFHGIIRFVQEN